MSTPILLRQHVAMATSRIAAGSSEDGIGLCTSTATSTNDGALILRTAGAPTTTGNINVLVQNGGLATGYTTETDGIPGATVVYKPSTAAADEYTGYIRPHYLTDIRKAKLANAGTDYRQISAPRRLANESIGFLACKNSAGNSLIFLYKSSRRTTWTEVTVSGTVSELHTPDFVLLPTGRLLAYAVVTGAEYVRAWYSDDNGATWAVWSKHTRVTVDVDGGTIAAATVRDGVVIAVGSSETVAMTSSGGIYWSANGGQSFTQTATAALCSPRIVATLDGKAVLFATNTVSTTVYAWPIAYGGGIPDDPASTTLTTVATEAVLGATVLDDGSMWVVAGSTQPTDVFSACVSIDGGASWSPVSGSVSGFKDIAYNRYAAGAYRQISVGSWHGAIVLLARVESGTAAEDDSVDEFWFGGWNDLTEEGFISDTAARDTCGLYGTGGVLYPQDLPSANGWAPANVGGGAVASVTINGINLVGSGANNTRYVAPAAFWGSGGGSPYPSGGDAFRFRWKTIVTTGGDIASDIAYLLVSISDTVNRQWVKIRFASNQARLVDNGGTLWTSAVSASFAAETEWMMAFAHDYPSAGGGQVSLWYRFASDTFWRVAVEAQAVAEEAADATEVVEYGGSVGATFDWTMMGPWYAPGSAEMDSGFTNPTDLAGRALGVWPVFLSRGTSVSGMGDAAVAGDSYLLAPSYAYASSKIVTSRPSSYWQTATTTGAESVVGGDGTMPFVVDTIALFGTNMRTMTWQANATDAWGAPSVSATLDATLYSTSVSASAAGALTLVGARMRPGQYKSREGRRYYVQVKATNPVFYEIADNDETTLFVTGLASGYGGEMVYVYGDRMITRIPTSARLYWRLLTGTETTPQTKRRIGTAVMGVRHELTIPYDNGFVDTWEQVDEMVETRRGYREAYATGPERHVLRIAWALVDRLSTDALWRVVDTFRALRGRSELVALQRDPTDLESLGLYMLEGPPATENAYGERADALERLAQVRLVEIQ